VWASAEALRPLSVAELERAVAALREALSQRLPDRAGSPDAAYSAWQFIAVELREPDKGEGGGPRRATAEVYHRPTRTLYMAVVDVGSGTVETLEPLPGVWPRIGARDFERCEAVVKSDPAVQAALRRRAVTDMSLVMADPESAGHYGDPRADTHRLARAFLWVRNRPGDNGYAHPVDGLSVLVDLDAEVVLDLEEVAEIPVPRPEANWTSALVTADRRLAPLDILQAEGPGFTVDANQELRWDRWVLQIGFTSREGLVLHRVRYVDGGRERPVLYRASVSDMVVPYGDPRPPQWRKNAFDAGEYGLGEMVSSLERGCDCLGEIRYLDVHAVDADGRVLTRPNAVCIHEEDYGVLWKHRDWRTDESEVRRSRRLVVSFFATVGNYDYGFFWYFYLDGTIQCEVKLTGIISTAAGPPSPYGQPLGDGLYGPIHQHFFNVRLDLDIDGPVNRIYEVDTEPAPAGPDNPRGNAFRAVPRLLDREAAAQRDVAPELGRFWRIVNPAVLNRVGQPVGYRLVPGENVARFAAAEAEVSRRAGFTAHHLWATPYRPAERFAAGDHPNQQAATTGLPEWTAENRPLVDTDLVVWYTFGAHHVVRLEDWPVMPVHAIGFHLRPDGFFDQNPALTLPAPHPPGHFHHRV